MPQITGGVVTFSRKIQVTQFEPKEAKVELAFAVGEGDMAGDSLSVGFLNSVCVLAHAKVFELIGMKPDANTLKAVEITAHVESVKPATAVEEKRGPGRPKKPPVIVVDTKAPVANISTGEDRKDPSDLDNLDIPIDGLDTPSDFNRRGQATEPSTATVAAAEDIDDLISPPAAKEITDADMISAITHKNQEIKNPVAIKSLVGQWVGGPPATARDIPQDKRQAFLDKLKELK